MSTTPDSRSLHLTSAEGGKEEGRGRKGREEERQRRKGGWGGEGEGEGKEWKGGRRERGGWGGREGGAKETTDWQSIANHINSTHAHIQSSPHILTHLFIAMPHSL